jgi:maltose O-acetyltransferase
MARLDAARYAIREESINLRVRLHLALALTSVIPDLCGNRTRAAALRLAGVEIGPGTVIGGRFTIAGPGRPERNVTIGASGWINAGCYFDASDRIEIGDDVAIGQQVLVLTQSHHMGPARRRAADLFTAPVSIGDGCWIGARATILPGVTIGAGSVVAAGALVRSDVPGDTVVAGVPATIRTRLDCAERRTPSAIGT